VYALENVGKGILYIDYHFILYCPPGKLGFPGKCERSLENGNTLCAGK